MLRRLANHDKNGSFVVDDATQSIIDVDGSLLKFWR